MESSREIPELQDDGLSASLSSVIDENRPAREISESDFDSEKKERYETPPQPNEKTNERSCLEEEIKLRKRNHFFQWIVTILFHGLAMMGSFLVAKEIWVGPQDTDSRIYFLFLALLATFIQYKILFYILGHFFKILKPAFKKQTEKKIRRLMRWCWKIIFEIVLIPVSMVVAYFIFYTLLHVNYDSNNLLNFLQFAFETGICFGFIKWFLSVFIACVQWFRRKNIDENL